MREILFRGKTEKGEWVQSGSMIHFNDEGTEKLFYIPKCNEKSVCVHDADDNILSIEEGTFYKVIPETIGQYTGLTDKNGKKIFEGDIIKTDNGRISAISVVQYGKFEPKMFYDLLEDYVRPRPKERLYGLFAKSKCGEEMFLSECSHLIEVIGNIHDNPELLEVTE